MAKNKKRKKVVKQQPPKQLKPEQYIVQKSKHLPIYECRMSDIESSFGLVSVVITKKHKGGGLTGAFYLIDKFCLGLKRTGWFFNVSEEDYKKDIVERLADSGLATLPTEPNLAYNLIYGAIEYAEDLGFEPMDKDFEISQYLMPPADEIEYIEIEFGKNGKPTYYEGPNDNIKKILRQLTEKLGPEGFAHITGEEEESEE